MENRLLRLLEACLLVYSFSIGFLDRNVRLVADISFMTVIFWIQSLLHFSVLLSIMLLFHKKYCCDHVSCLLYLVANLQVLAHAQPKTVITDACGPEHHDWCMRTRTGSRNGGDWGALGYGFHWDTPSSSYIKRMEVSVMPSIICWDSPKPLYLIFNSRDIGATEQIL